MNRGVSNYIAQAKPMDAISQYTARIPFSIAGTIDNPKFSAAGLP